MKSRRAALLLTYDGADISKSVAKYVREFTFTDNASGQADDLSVSLNDRAGQWHGGWFPEKGAKLKASIRCEDWFTPGASALVLPCGTFAIDEVEYSAGSGDVVTFKAVSSLVANSIRKEKRTRAWENVRLSTIASDIGAAHSLGIQFEGTDAIYTRVDQRDESDLALLQRLAEDEGLHLKLADAKLIIYSGSEYDKYPVSHTITRGESNLGTVRLSTKTTDVYRAATVKYHDAADKQLKTYTYTPPSPSVGGQVLQINQAVESIAQAERLAKSRLRSKNKREVSGTLSLMGDPRITAAQTVALAKFGTFDGKYFIEQATHGFSRNGGYTTSINVRRVLDY